jgi:hypothetical protein
MTKSTLCFLTSFALLGAACSGDDKDAGTPDAGTIENPDPDAAIATPDAMVELECPANFLPADVNATPPFAQIDDEWIPGATTAIAPIFDDVNVALLVAYDGEVAIGEDLALSADLENLPLVGAGYDLDVIAQTIRVAYQATGGTINFTTHCAVGTSGTIANASFVEVTQENPPMAVEGGCAFTAEAIAFSIGDACPTE